DHPWVDSAEGAAVRISMTVAVAGGQPGKLLQVIGERDHGELGAEVTFRESLGQIQQNLSVGADVAGTGPLRANDGLSCRGVSLHGAGFIVTLEEAERLGLGVVPGIERHIRGYRNGRDLTQTPRGVMVIDLFGLSSEDARVQYPSIYQRVVERVKPERDQNNRATYRDNWWVFGEPRKAFRPALAGLRRFIATVETSKHRFFTFLDESILPDNMLVNIAQADAYQLGVLSSRIHVTWALAAGGTLEDRPRYNKTRCFETFPFPDADHEASSRIRDLAEQLDAHRKRQQERHADLTMTGMYNVLEKLRSGEPLTKKEQTIHEQGLVSVLKQIHDDLDAAVFDAYGWPHDLTDEQILERLVALNHERADEESRGLIRWLRPDFQNPAGKSQTQLPTSDEPDETDEDDAAVDKGKGAKPAKGKSSATKGAKPKKQPWPKPLPERIRALRTALTAEAGPTTADDLAKQFNRAKKADIAELLDTLVEVGQARVTKDGQYVG
ncbi:MAG: type IIL restriction-modification enzyme MmeI, partial [Planctomycetaceae bacterium]